VLTIGALWRGMASGGVDMQQLPLEQLVQLKDELSAELEQLGNSSQQLRIAAGGYAATKQSLTSLTPANKDKEVLIPLTESLYVPGTLAEVETVLLDIGTGYYVEKSPVGAGEFMSRKLELVQESIKRVADIAQQKRQQLEMVTMTIQQKAQAAQQAGQAA
jgi:prefoldin alpha subunit